MSLDKAIEHGKEKRKPYRGEKSVDKHCRNHGYCKWREGNRLYKSNKKITSTDDSLKEWEND